jgi:hypothetical protein
MIENGASDHEIAKRFRVSRDAGEPVAAGPGGRRPGGAGPGARAGPGASSPRRRSPNWRRLLDVGPAAAGYLDQCLTLARIADQVGRRFGVE